MKHVCECYKLNRLGKKLECVTKVPIFIAKPVPSVTPLIKYLS